MKKIFFGLILSSVLGFSQSKVTSLPDLNTLTIDSVFTVKPVHFNPNSKSNYSFSMTNPSYNMHSKNIYETNWFDRNPNFMMQYKTTAFSSSIGYNFGTAITVGLLNSIFN